MSAPERRRGRERLRFFEADVQSAQSDNGACTTAFSTELQCPLGNVTPGNLIGVTIVVLPTAPGTYQFTAKSTAFGGTPNSANGDCRRSQRRPRRAGAQRDASNQGREDRSRRRHGRQQRAGRGYRHIARPDAPCRREARAAPIPSGACSGSHSPAISAGSGQARPTSSCSRCRGVKPGTGHLVCDGGRLASRHGRGERLGHVAVTVPKPPKPPKPHKR